MKKLAYVLAWIAAIIFFIWLIWVAIDSFVNGLFIQGITSVLAIPCGIAYILIGTDE